MKILFLSDDRPLHRAFEKAFEGKLEAVKAREVLLERLDYYSEGILVLDAEYQHVSGYAICEEIKTRFKDQWQVHLLSNETCLGEAQKAEYAGVDRLILIPHGVREALL